MKPKTQDVFTSSLAILIYKNVRVHLTILFYTSNFTLILFAFSSVSMERLKEFVRTWKYF